MKMELLLNKIYQVQLQYDNSFTKEEVKLAVYYEALIYFQYLHGINISELSIRYLLSGLHKVGCTEGLPLHFQLNNLRNNYHLISSSTNFSRAAIIYAQFPNQLKLFLDIKNNEINKQADFQERINIYLNSYQQQFPIKKNILKPVLKLEQLANEYLLPDMEQFLNFDRGLGEERLRKGGTISISIAQLKEAAVEMDTFTNENYVKRLDDFDLLSYFGHGTSESHELKLEEVVHIVGMVGAGKSTLINVLTYWLAKNGYRVALVQDKVTEVVKQATYFEQFHLSSCAINGFSQREDRINQFMENDEMLLSLQAANYMTGVCLYSSLKNKNYNHLEVYGRTPCFSLEGKKSHEKFICPFFNICPRMEQLKKLQRASVVCVNVYSFLLTKSHVVKNRGRLTMLEYLIDYMDVVIFDEADEMQVKLDDVLNVSEEVNELIRKSNQFIQSIQNDRLNGIGQYHFYDLPILATLVSNTLQKMNKLLIHNKSILKNLNRIKNGQWFTAKILIEEINALPKNLVDDLKEYISEEGNVFIELENASMHSDEERRTALEKIYSKYSIVEEWQKTVEFILALMLFERNFFKLQYELQYEMPKFSERIAVPQILQRHNQNLMNLLPDAPTNNRFGFIYDSEENGGKILKVFKQNGMGRSAMLDLPFLKVNEKGKALGPHTILLSGSSYAIGSSAHHIYKNVNYILKPPKKTMDFLENITLKVVESNVIVSGSNSKTRALRQLVEEAKDELLASFTRSSRSLIIVNSYEQAKIVQEQLNEITTYDVYRVIPDYESKEIKTVQRSNLNKVKEDPFKALIAPATIIARGHNMVNDIGHSLFADLIFLIRPIDPPRQINQIISMMNGEVYHRVSKQSKSPFATDVLLNVSELKKESYKYWHLAMKTYYGIEKTPEKLKLNIIASRIVLIMQILGRLLRIQLPLANYPVIKLFDAAFVGTTPFSFNLYEEMHKYLIENTNHSEHGEIMSLLYSPILKAMEGEKVNYAK